MHTQLLTCTAIVGPDLFTVEASVMFGLEKIEICRYYLEFSNGLSGVVYATSEAIRAHIPLDTPHFYKVSRSAGVDRRASIRPFTIPKEHSDAPTVQREHPSPRTTEPAIGVDPSRTTERNAFLRDIVLSELDGLISDLEQHGLDVDFEGLSHGKALSHLELLLISLTQRIRAFVEDDEGPYTSAWLFNVTSPIGLAHGAGQPRVTGEERV